MPGRRTLHLPARAHGAQGLPEGLQSLHDVLDLQVLPALHEMARHPQQQGGAAGAAAAAAGGQPASAALRQYPLGFSTGDGTADLAATILRML